jgi:hypothetical protein
MIPRLSVTFLLGVFYAADGGNNAPELDAEPGTGNGGRQEMEMRVRLLETPTAAVRAS